MAKTVIGERAKAKPARRAGRPPKHLAGEVDSRIMDAGHRVFMKSGLAGASMDEIARLAPVSKPTLYARFSTKEDLFAAVLVHKVNAKVAQLGSFPPVGATAEERIVRLGIAIVQELLGEETVALLRLAIAEAPRFPDLAKSMDVMARGRFRDSLGKLLAEVAQTSGFDASPAFAPERLLDTAGFFLNLISLPLVMRALLGEKLETIRAEIVHHVANSASFFLAACRQSGLEVRHAHGEGD